jgi:hypothetical protein
VGILPAGVEIANANTQCLTLLLVGDFLYLCLKISGEMTLKLREWQSRYFYYSQYISSSFFLLSASVYRTSAQQV